MGPETPLRIAGPSDVGPVTRLVAGFRDFLGSGSPGNAEIEATAGILLQDRSTEFLLIGDPEVGFAQIRYRLSIWTGSEDAWIEDGFVAQVAQGKGFGAKLLDGAISRALSRGCGRVQLDTTTLNEETIALCTSRGFSNSHRVDKWPDGADILFTKTLKP